MHCPTGPKERQRRANAIEVSVGSSGLRREGIRCWLSGLGLRAFWLGAGPAKQTEVHAFGPESECFCERNGNRTWKQKHWQ